MSPSFNSFGSNPSVSQLVWDTDLVIPAGKAIESASGELGIIGDVSISGSVSSGGSVSADTTITAQTLTANTANITDCNIGTSQHTLVANTYTTSATITTAEQDIPPVYANANISGTVTLKNAGSVNINGNVTVTGIYPTGNSVVLRTSSAKIPAYGTGNVAIPSTQIPTGITTIKTTTNLSINAVNMAITNYTTSFVL